jgi:hypothetical protein
MPCLGYSRRQEPTALFNTLIQAKCANSRFDNDPGCRTVCQVDGKPTRYFDGDTAHPRARLEAGQTIMLSYPSNNHAVPPQDVQFAVTKIRVFMNPIAGSYDATDYPYVSFFSVSHFGFHPGPWSRF